MEKIFSDTPKEYTSSIGSTTWPPEKASFERKKGVYPEVIDTPQNLENFLESLRLLPFDTSTRISVRACVLKEILSNFINNNRDNPHLKIIETIISLEGTNSGLDDCCLIYVGKNKPERMPNEQQLAEQKELATKIFSNNHRLNPKQPINNNHRLDDLTIRVINEEDKKNPNIQMMYYDLYKIFGWNEEDIKALLSNPNNILVAAFGENQTLIGSVLGEFGELTFKRNNMPVNLRLIEITEAAVKLEHRGKGIYQVVSDTLISTFTRMKNPPHLVFGELNLESPAVLTVAAKQGRTPALNTAKNFDIPNAWFLPQHVPISNGSTNKTGYNNLMVAYLTQKDLMNFNT
ncbi:MAG: hypothetical protein KatS3mg092_0927 [Patescibacteria group bacterium]|nr:MAG: hypothetical protein KatS3mg092_0927 [Patescibacteria group bacterium]